MARRKDKTNNEVERSNLSQTSSETKEKEASGQEVDIGLDISTAITGVCVLDHKTGELIYLGHIKFKAKHKTLWQKADFAKEQLVSILSNKGYSFKRIFVEENAKRFTPGFSSANTILTLAKFNGIISYLARGVFGAEPVDVNVMSARKALGIKIDREDKTKTTKEKVRVEVMKLFSDLPLKKHIAKTGKSKGLEVINKECEDEIDAFVIAKGGRSIFK